MTLNDVLVFTEIYMPLVSRPFMVLYVRSCKVLLKNLSVAFIHFHKVLNHFIVVQLSSCVQDCRKTKMLNMMTPVTKSDETDQFLFMFTVVVLPTLVTV